MPAFEQAHEKAQSPEAESNQDAGIHKEGYSAAHADSKTTQPSDKNHLPAVTIVEANKREASDEQLQNAAKAINEAGSGWGTDKEKIFTVLQNIHTEADRKALAAIYSKKYGTTLDAELRDELSGHDLDKAINLLNKKDNNPADDAAGRIHQALIERGQVFAGRSDANCEKDIRDTLSTMNSVEIAQLDKAYRSKYGKSLHDALIDDTNLSQSTKAAAEVYFKGSDNRPAEMTLKVAETALTGRNLPMFEEAMSMASPEARKKFMDNHGEEKLHAAFGNSTNFDHAKDYATDGKLSTSSKVRANSGWLNDNEEAIEKSVAEMSKAERIAYMQGRDLATGKNVAGLNAEQKAHARETYQEIHTTIAAAGNANEVRRWEDMIAVKGGTLVSKLAAHQGTFKDDDVSTVLGEIENIDKANWEKLKTDAQFRGELQSALGFLDRDEMARVNEALDQKQNSKTYEEAQGKRRSIVELIKDGSGFFNDDEVSIYKAIANMSPAEQKRYRENPAFREEIDNKLSGTLDSGAEMDAARRMLTKIVEGKTPEEDIIAKLDIEAGKLNTDESQVVRDLQEAFARDPGLRDRVNNPKTAEDKKLSEAFNSAIHRALDADEYARYAEPLLRTGHLGLDVQNKLNTGLINDDEQGAYKDLIALSHRTDAASVAEKQKILTDANYQDKALGLLSADERQVALLALRQGEMKPEDLIRSHTIGVGTDEEEIKEVISKLTPEQKIELAKTYSTKYGSDLSADLVDELGGQDSKDVKRQLQQPAKDAREAFDRARDEYYQSRDGIGSAFVDKAWDGTGYMSDESLSNFRAALAKSSSEFKSLSPEEQNELSTSLRESVDAFVKSKGAAADAVVDGVIIAAGVGGAFFTGGLSLSLLAQTAAAGAIFKLAVKPTIVGADYDWSSSQTVVDGLTGAIDAASIVVGPAQLGQLFKLGEKCAATTAARLLEDGSEQLIKNSMKDAAEKKIFETVATAVSNGEKAISDKAIATLAKGLAVDGSEKQLAQVLKKNLAECMEQESRSYLKRTLTEVALNSGSAFMGGGSSGAVRAASEWNSSKSFGDNIANVAEQAALGGLTSAGGAAFFTVGLKALGGAFEQVTSKSVQKVIEPGLAAPMKVEGKAIEPERWYVIGRESANSSDIQIADQYVSGQHAALYVDSKGNRYIKDLGSTNGTFVNGKRITSGEAVMIKSSDNVTLGVNHALKLTEAEDFKVRIGNDNVNLKPGEEVAIGRNHQNIEDSRVSRDHARMGSDAKGTYIVDVSSNGTFVTRQGETFKLTRGDKFYLQAGDEVGLGASARNGGARLNLDGADNKFRAVDKQPEVAQIERRLDQMQELPEPTGRIEARALAQSKEYAEQHYLTGKIVDGWHMAGAEAEYFADGSFRTHGIRPAIVVDRQHDPILRAVLDEAKRKFGHLPPEQRAVELTKYAKELLTPKGMKERDLDSWYNSFNNAYNGKRVYLGEMLRQGKGVCSQQAILLKLMGDEFDDMSVRLVRGHYGFGDGSTNLNHAWNEIVFENGKHQVFDPRHQKMGKTYKDMQMHHPGIGADAKVAAAPEIGDVIRYDGVDGWLVSEVKDGMAVITHSGVRSESADDLNRLNGGKALGLGQEYRVRRSNGDIEGGWILTGRNADGTLQLRKENSVSRKVQLAQLNNIKPGYAADANLEIIDVVSNLNKPVKLAARRQPPTQSRAAQAYLPQLDLVS